MSSIFRSHVQELLVFASLSASGAALGCSSGFSSCLELATCGGSAGEAGAGGAADHENPGGNAAASAGAAGTGGSANMGVSGRAGASNAGAPNEGGAPGDGESGRAGSGDAAGAGRAGDGGTAAGEGGEGGDASDLGGSGGVGGEGEPACQSDAACDDGFSCNGVERCVEGACAAGEPVECVSAAVGCNAVCEEQTAGPRCVTRAADADADGHGTSRCQEAFGDDCDDGDSRVHAGAPELCDTLDNDCDGSTDLSDGVPLQAASVALDGFSPSVVWSEHHAAFGVMWVGRSESANQLRGATLTTDAVLRPWPVTSLSSTSAAYLSPVLIDDGSGFAAIYQTGNRGGQLGHFASIDSDGTAHYRDVDALHTDIIHRKDGGFSLAGDAAGLLRVELLLIDGGSAYSTYEDVTPLSPRIATVDSTDAVIWQVKNTTLVDGLLLQGSEEIAFRFGPTEGASPDITSAGEDFVAAWSTRNGMALQRMRIGGSLPCIGADVALPAAAMTDRALAIASTDHHSFVLVTDKLNGAVSLLRFDDQCRWIDQATLDSDAPAASRPSISVGGGHVAACWSEGTSEDHSECRVMGIELCDG